MVLALPYLVALGGWCAQESHYPSWKSEHVVAGEFWLGAGGCVILMLEHLQVCVG